MDPNLDRAQYRYDMHYDQPEDKDDADTEQTEDDITEALGDDD